MRCYEYRFDASEQLSLESGDIQRSMPYIRVELDTSALLPEKSIAEALRHAFCEDLGLAYIEHTEGGAGIVAALKSVYAGRFR